MSPSTSEIESRATLNSSQPEDFDQPRISVLDLLLVIAEHKRWVLQFTGIFALLSTCVVFLIPNRYTATTRILPPQQNQSLMNVMSGQLAAMGPLAAAAGANLGLKNPNDLYVGMLKSWTVENALVDHFELMKVYGESRQSDAREHLEKAAAIAVGKEGFITISVEDRDGARAASMANTYVAELQKLTQKVAVTEAGQRRIFFEQQVKQATENLAAAEQALKETQQKTGILQLDGQAKAIIESVVRLRAQIAAKEVQLQTMHSFATAQNPDLLLAQQELEGLRAQLAKLERQSTSNGDVQIPTGSVPQSGLEYVRRLREVKYQETLYELLSKQLEVARLDEAKQGAVIQVIDKAVQPDKKSSPKRALIIIVMTFLGLFLAITWTLFSEAFQRMQELEPDHAQRLQALKSSLLGRL